MLSRVLQHTKTDSHPVFLAFKTDSHPMFSCLQPRSSNIQTPITASHRCRVPRRCRSWDSARTRTSSRRTLSRTSCRSRGSRTRFTSTRAVATSTASSHPGLNPSTCTRRYSSEQLFSVQSRESRQLHRSLEGPHNHGIRQYGSHRTYKV